MDELWLSAWDAQKRRLRKRSREGRDVAVALDPPAPLSDGDVLYAGEGALVVARIEPAQVVVFRLAGAPTPTVLAERALRLGHVLGNQHWPVRLRPASTLEVVEGDPAESTMLEVDVPLSLDARVVDAVLRAHRLRGVSYAFRPATPEEAGAFPAPPLPHADDHAYRPEPGHAHPAALHAPALDGHQH